MFVSSRTKNPIPDVAQTRISVHPNADEDAHQQPYNLVTSSFNVPSPMSASVKTVPQPLPLPDKQQGTAGPTGRDNAPLSRKQLQKTD